MMAEQLLPDTDAKYRLPQRAYNVVKAMLTKVGHSRTCLSLSGEEHLVSLHQLLGVVCDCRLYAEASQAVHYRVYVSRVVFDYCYVHVYTLCVVSGGDSWIFLILTSSSFSTLGIASKLALLSLNENVDSLRYRSTRFCLPDSRPSSYYRGLRPRLRTIRLVQPSRLQLSGGGYKVV